MAGWGERCQQPTTPNPAHTQQMTFSLGTLQTATASDPHSPLPPGDTQLPCACPPHSCHHQSPRVTVNFTCHLPQQPGLLLRPSFSSRSDLRPAHNPPPTPVPPLMAHFISLDKSVPRHCLYFKTSPSLLCPGHCRKLPLQGLAPHQPPTLDAECLPAMPQTNPFILIH